mmetsp:Transcript_34009/g.88754  ORF Transcript_34009/g.88754 Transcript_34009/m.88754 type:complete len:531 (-) Transcript_34009:67-1659(-)
MERQVNVGFVQQFATEDGFDAEACLAEAAKRYGVVETTCRIRALDTSTTDVGRAALISGWANEERPAKRTRRDQTLKISSLGRVYEVPGGGKCKDVLDSLVRLHCVFGTLYDDQGGELFEEDVIACDELRFCPLPLCVDWESVDATLFARAATAVRIDGDAGSSEQAGPDLYRKIMEQCPNATEVTETLEAIWCGLDSNEESCVLGVTLEVSWALPRTQTTAWLGEQIGRVGLFLEGSHEFQREQALVEYDQDPVLSIHLGCTDGSVPTVRSCGVEGSEAEAAEVAMKFLRSLAAWSPPIGGLKWSVLCEEALEPFRTQHREVGCRFLRELEVEYTCAGIASLVAACPQVETVRLGQLHEDELRDTLLALGSRSRLRHLQVSLKTDHLADFEKDCLQHLQHLEVLEVNYFSSVKSLRMFVLPLAGLREVTFEALGTVGDLSLTLATGKALQKLALSGISELGEAGLEVLPQLPMLRFVSCRIDRRKEAEEHPQVARISALLRRVAIWSCDVELGCWTWKRLSRRRPDVDV